MPPVAPPSSGLVSVRRAAELLSVSEYTVRFYLANGVLPVVKLPATTAGGATNRRVLIREADIQKLIDRSVEKVS